MEKNEKKVPFFAKFLENQVKEDKSVKGGSDTTTKLDDVFTDKYPSDADEVTSPKLDIQVTMKYPSDGDEVTSPGMDEF